MPPSMAATAQASPPRAAQTPAPPLLTATMALLGRAQALVLRLSEHFFSTWS